MNILKQITPLGSFFRYVFNRVIGKFLQSDLNLD